MMQQNCNVVQEINLEIFLMFNPVSRKLKHIFSEAEPFGCRNQVDVLKLIRQIKSYGCLVLLPLS